MKNLEVNLKEFIWTQRGRKRQGSMRVLHCPGEIHEVSCTSLKWQRRNRNANKFAVSSVFSLDTWDHFPNMETKSSEFEAKLLLPTRK